MALPEVALGLLRECVLEVQENGLYASKTKPDDHVVSFRGAAPAGCSANLLFENAVHGIQLREIQLGTTVCSQFLELLGKMLPQLLGLAAR
jgi:hypothetical protein